MGNSNSYDYKSLGGEAGLQQIYRKLPDFKPLDEKALRINPKYGKRPLYHHWVRSHIKDLCQKDDLERTSRAYYSLTDKGMRRLNSLIPLLRKLNQRESSKKVGLIKSVDKDKNTKA